MEIAQNSVSHTYVYLKNIYDAGFKNVCSSHLASEFVVGGYMPGNDVYYQYRQCFLHNEARFFLHACTYIYTQVLYIPMFLTYIVFESF